MKVYRITKTTYADDLTGTGAQLYGERWNPRGFQMVYTAGSLSLATLEFLAHNFHLMPKLELTLTVLEIHEKSAIEKIDEGALPAQWRNIFKGQNFTQGLGAEFLSAKRAYALKVPSIIVPSEFNILLNPNHPQHQQVKILEKISPFQIDKRLAGLATDKV